MELRQLENMEYLKSLKVMKLLKEMKLLKVKAGGTAQNGMSFRVSISKEWAKVLELNEEERDIITVLDEENQQIIIKKKNYV